VTAGQGLAPDGLARLVETHVSTLFFVGDRVYKRKKPVATGFLDFRTVGQRRRACEAEVELNRRLSPDVYLGVATVLDVDGAACDHLVVMRRLPEDRRLAALARAGSDITGPLREIARLLAVFHSQARRDAEVSAAAAAATVAQRWEDNFSELTPFVGSVLDSGDQQRLRTLVRGFLAGREPLFRSRIAQGRACEGHGDLLAQDIFCLDDGPRVLDCIEFDPGLRYSDVLADVAFLAMDLERLGVKAEADSFLAAYREFSGDAWPASLEHHYLAYRALIRSKVACLCHGQGDESAAREAVGLHELALRHAAASEVRLVLIGGLPGTGKTAVARRSADVLGATLLRSDEIRAELAGGAAEPAAGFEQGRYRPEATALVYRELLHRAGSALRMGETVILDASWRSPVWREAARQLASTGHARLVPIECRAPATLAARRIRQRRLAGGDASEATERVASVMAAQWAPWDEAFVVDNAGALDAAVADALAAVAGDRHPRPADPASVGWIQPDEPPYPPLRPKATGPRFLGSRRGEGTGHGWVERLYRERGGR
jgi:aminoglycoside phosphotransferase family enzyme/predicted kinase